MSDLQSQGGRNLEELRAKLQQEPIGSFLGLRLVELAEGYAKVTMKVRPEYLNFNSFIFGGIIVSVADQAFACATNSMGHPSVASQFNIHFIAGAAIGDELTAECRVVRKGRRVHISEITVTNQKGSLVAKASGTAIPMT